MRGADGVGGEWVDAVEADEGVEVRDASCLHFGDLAVGQLDLDAVLLAPASEGVFGAFHGAAPQFAGQGVPDDLVVVVVAVQAKRGAEDLFAVAVGLVAALVDAVGAEVGLAAGAARLVAELPVVASDLASGVDGSEGWRGEGDEGAGVLCDGCGDAFAAPESGEDELVGVGAVDLCAGGADGGAAVAAGFVDDAVGHVVGVAGGDDPAGAFGDDV